MSAQRPRICFRLSPQDYFSDPAPHPQLHDERLPCPVLGKRPRLSQLHDGAPPPYSSFLFPPSEFVTVACFGSPFSLQ